MPILSYHIQTAVISHHRRIAQSGVDIPFQVNAVGFAVIGLSQQSTAEESGQPFFRLRLCVTDPVTDIEIGFGSDSGSWQGLPLGFSTGSAFLTGLAVPGVEQSAPVPLPTDGNTVVHLPAEEDGFVDSSSFSSAAVTLAAGTYSVVWLAGSLTLLCSPSIC